MSRHEILELEKELKSLDDPEANMEEDQYVKDEEGNLINVNPKFLEL